jgi:hypothetical protein
VLKRSACRGSRHERTFVNLKLHDNKAPGDRQKAAWRIAASHATKLSFSSPARLILEIDITQFLPGVVYHDKAGVQFLDGPGRRLISGGCEWRA